VYELKRSYKILTSALVLGALVFGGVMATSASSPLEDRQAATEAVTAYVKAFEANDIDSITRYVKDARAKDEADLHANYEQYIKRNQELHTKLKLLNVEVSADGTITAAFEMASDGQKTVQFSLPVVKEKGEWKLFVDGSLVIDTKQ
jgi:hypothetical protein